MVTLKKKFKEVLNNNRITCVGNIEKGLKIWYNERIMFTDRNI